jgi:hypothetical protein
MLEDSNCCRGKEDKSDEADCCHDEKRSAIERGKLAVRNDIEWRENQR